MNQKLQILIVDDDAELALNLKDLLEGEGYNTVVANDGKTALTLCLEQVFDLGLIDFKLPDIRGVELVDKLVKLSPTTEYIIITGHASLDSAVEAVRQKKIAAYETKPLDMDHLLPLVRHIIERSQAEKALRDSQERFRSMYEESPIGIELYDSDGKLLEVNKACLDMFGVADVEEIKGLDLFEDPNVTDELKERLRKGETARYEVAFDFEKIEKLGLYETTKAGVVYLGVLITPLGVKEERALGGYLVQVQDIDKQKRAQEQIQASLREKEVLLKEIHHRVKNNLQVISSLLDMTGMRIHDQQANDLITDARSKIHTMALIHTRLYRSERFDQIDMRNHILELVGYLSQIYSEREGITPVVEPTTVNLAITQAIPCALVLNEVISNAFKHAFKQGQKGMIEISIKRSDSDTIFIRVKDDGIGIPEEVDIYKTDSLGLKLLRNLVHNQLKGKIDLKRDKGTEFIIEFKTLEERTEYAQNNGSGR
jgi:PAS domain S-box-containing protein